VLPGLDATTKAWGAAAFLARLGCLAAPTITDSSVGRRKFRAIQPELSLG
jgi:hypothetical protein